MVHKDNEEIGNEEVDESKQQDVETGVRPVAETSEEEQSVNWTIKIRKSDGKY